MFEILVGLCLFIAIIPLGINLGFRGKDHSQYDHPRPKTKGSKSPESPEHQAAVANILHDIATTPKGTKKERLQYVRAQMDHNGKVFGDDVEIRPVMAAGREAEWVLAPNADSNRRVLYIHGGAYMEGSPESHRIITSRMSKIAKAAVLAIDYRLLPEHTRMDGIKDCRAAYRWLLENGPDGESQIEVLIVAGDSAGGNLALSTIAWARDTNLRAADVVVAFSPQTDLTLESPSIVANLATDAVLGGAFDTVVKAPRFIKLAFSFYLQRINPRNPIVSPLLGDLSGLPPILIQGSETEMLFDDEVRYANKANSQGSKVILQTWPSTMHVWQAFDCPETDEAFACVEDFITSLVPLR